MFPVELLQSISQTKATLKIITKTKNERLFIEKWIQHHLAIIGDGKLIIFDNMSDDEYVLNVYEKYKEHIILIKFNGYPDDIHSYGLLNAFYLAIRASSDFFTIIDSDEYLYFYDDKTNKVIHDSSIVDYLEKNIDCDFFAPCWLENIEKCANTLKVTHEFSSRFSAGKPILHTRIFNSLEQKDYSKLMFRHVFELPSLRYIKAKTSFLIAHLKNLNLDQRIITDMNKLVSLGIVSNAKDFLEIYNIQPKRINNTYIQNLIKKTKELVKIKIDHGDYPTKEVSKEKTLTIEQDATITFSDPFFKHAFSSLMNANYLKLIDYDSAEVDPDVYPTLDPWIKRSWSKK